MEAVAAFKKDNEMSTEISTKTNDKIQAQFLCKKKLFYSDHHELANSPFGFENQGTNISDKWSVLGHLTLVLRKSVQESHDLRNDFPKLIWSAPEALHLSLLTPS